MDTHILPLKPPNPPLLKIIYNQIHLVQLLCTPPLPQQKNLHTSPPPPSIFGTVKKNPFRAIEMKAQ